EFDDPQAGQWQRRHGVSSDRTGGRMSLRETGSGELAEEGLPRQKACELALRFEQDVYSNAGLHAHPVEHEGEVLGRDVAAGSRRVGAATETAERRVERANAGIERGNDVGEARAAGVVEMR